MILIDACSTDTIKNIGTTRYRLQNNNQVKRLHHTITSKLRYFVPKHHTDPDMYLLPSM